MLNLKIIKFKKRLSFDSHSKFRQILKRIVCESLDDESLSSIPTSSTTGIKTRNNDDMFNDPLTENSLNIKVETVTDEDEETISPLPPHSLIELKGRSGYTAALLLAHNFRRFII